MANHFIKIWQERLGITDWVIRTRKISPGQIEYNGEDYFIGIERDFDRGEAVIYHDVPLCEESIVHELMHIVFPEKNGEDYDEYEKFIDKLSRDTLLLHYIN